MKPVGGYAFFNNFSLTEIKLPGSVASIRMIEKEGGRPVA